MAIFPGDRVRCAWGPLSGWQQQWNPCSLGSGLKANDGHHFSLLFPQTIFLNSFGCLGLKACHLFCTKKMYITGLLQECVLETNMCIVQPHISFQKCIFFYFGKEKWFSYRYRKVILLCGREKGFFFLSKKSDVSFWYRKEKGSWIIFTRKWLCLEAHCAYGQVSKQLFGIVTGVKCLEQEQNIVTTHAGDEQKHCQRHNGPEGWVHLPKVTY